MQRVNIGRFHILTDYHFQQHFSHAELAERAIRGGADAVQFRHKGEAVRHLLHEAAQVGTVCRNAGVPLLINDRIDIALAIEADGVHLGQTDFPVAEARRILGPGVVIGATATTVEQAREAEEAGANYIGFGPVYPTNSKSNPASVKGLQGLRAVCTAVAVPVIAIAGITPDRVRPVMEAGAHGFAVMTGISTAPSPEDAAVRFREALDAFLEAERVSLS